MKKLIVNDPYKIGLTYRGNAYKNYRDLWTLANRKQYTGYVPIHMIFDTIDACNAQCVICHDRGRKRSGRKMDIRVAKRLIDQGAGKGLFSINFGGVGEPYLAKDILYELASYGKKKGLMDIFMHTNFLTADPVSIRDSIDAGVNVFSISVDAATPETYKLIRGGDFQKVFENIRYLSDFKKARSMVYPIIRISAVPCSENQAELSRFFSFWEPYADVVEIQNFRYEQEQTSQGMVVSKLANDCTSPWRQLMVWPHGYITACCYKGGLGSDVCLGNTYIDNETLNDYWTKGTINLIREGLSGKDLSKIPSCKSCLRKCYIFNH